MTTDRPSRPDEKLVLNHIRGFTSLYLFGFVEGHQRVADLAKAIS